MSDSRSRDPERNLFEHNSAEDPLIAESPASVQDLNAGDPAVGCVVHGNAFGHVLGRHGRLDKPDIQGVNLAVVSNTHVCPILATADDHCQGLRRAGPALMPVLELALGPTSAPAYRASTTLVTPCPWAPRTK